jgi:hypothetical protein
MFLLSFIRKWFILWKEVFLLPNTISWVDCIFHIKQIVEICLVYLGLNQRKKKHTLIVIVSYVQENEIIKKKSSTPSFFDSSLQYHEIKYIILYFYIFAKLFYSL